jgi:hypothetical protein
MLQRLSVYIVISPGTSPYMYFDLQRTVDHLWLSNLLLILATIHSEYYNHTHAIHDTLSHALSGEDSTLKCIPYSTAVTFPLDITKTRLQIQGQRGELVKRSKVLTELKGKHAHRGMLRTLFGISMSYLAYTCTNSSNLEKGCDCMCMNVHVHCVLLILYA